MGMELWFWEVIHNILPTNLPIYLQFSIQNLIFYLLFVVSNDSTPYSVGLSLRTRFENSSVWCCRGKHKIDNLYCMQNQVKYQISLLFLVLDSLLAMLLSICYMIYKILVHIYFFFYLHLGLDKNTHYSSYTCYLFRICLNF